MHFRSEGQGKPLLLVHGIGSSSRVWLPFLPPLASDRTIIAVDLPGATANHQHGKRTQRFLVWSKALKPFLKHKD